MTGTAWADGDASPRLLPASLLLLLVSALLLFAGLGDYPLLDRDESRYGQIPREMLERGDWLTPTLYDEVYTDKPPLQYWQVMISFLVFGRSEFAARLPVVLAALALIQGVFWLAGRSAGTRAGFLSGLILTSMLFFFGLARYLVLDGVLSAYTMLAAFLAYANLPRPPSDTDPVPASGAAILGQRSRLRSAAVWILLGLAVLVKGPVALILFGMPFILLRIWQYGPAWLWSPSQWLRLMADVHLGMGLILLLAIATPWFVGMESAHPGYLHEFFLNQNLKRFASNSFSRSQPFYFFIGIAAAGLFPWTPFLPGAVRHFFRGGWRKVAQTRPLEAFALLLGLFPVVFFSLSSSKLIPYIAPSFPGFALFLGLYFHSLLSNPDAQPPRVAAAVAGVAALAIGLTPGVYLWLLAEGALQPSLVLPPLVLALFALPMLLLGGYLVLGFARLTTQRIVAALVTGMFALFGLVSIGGFTSQLGQAFSHAALMRALDREESTDHRPLLLFRENDEHASAYFYAEHWQDLIAVHQHEEVQEALWQYRSVRILLHRRDARKVTAAVGPEFSITPLREIGNTLEWAVQYKAAPAQPPKP